MKDQRKNSQPDDVASEILKNLKNQSVEIINPNQNPGSGKKKYLIAALLLTVIFAGAGFAAWKLFSKKDNQAVNPSPAGTVSQGNVASESPANELTQEYTSDRMLIDFKYPADWKVDELSREITIYSPAVELADVNGDNFMAEFRVLVKQGAGETDSEYLGRGLAIKESRPIKYTDPSSNQREKSLVTDFGLDSSAYFSYFVVQGNFNLKKDETLGLDFAGEADEILVSGGFYSKDSKDKTKLISLEADAYENNKLYLTAIEIVKTLRLR